MILLPIFECKGCHRWLQAESKDINWPMPQNREAEITCPFCKVVEKIPPEIAASWRDLALKRR